MLLKRKITFLLPPMMKRRSQLHILFFVCSPSSLIVDAGNGVSTTMTILPMGFQRLHAPCIFGCQKEGHQAVVMSIEILSQHVCYSSRLLTSDLYPNELSQICQLERPLLRQFVCFWCSHIKNAPVVIG